MTWSIQIRKATIIKEEQADGSKLELTRKFHRHVLMPFDSHVDERKMVQMETRVR